MIVALQPPNEEVAIMRRANAVRGLVSWPFAVLGLVVALQFVSNPFLALIAFYACLLPVRFVFGAVARRMELPVKPEWKEMIAPKDPLFWPLSIGVAIVTIIFVLTLQFSGHESLNVQTLLIVAVSSIVILNLAQWSLLIAGGRHAR